MLKIKNNVNSLFIKNKIIFNLKRNILIINQIQKTNKFILNRNLISNQIKFSLCENTKSNNENNNSNNTENDQNIKRYSYEYEAPENSDFEYKSKLKRIFMFLFHFSLFSLGIYIFFFRKLNILTKKYELYFLNESLETKIATFISKKIQKIFENYIQKHDSEDALFVYDIYKFILEKNGIVNNKTNSLIKNENIYVIQSENLGCLILKNGDLFISSRLVDLSKNNPNYLAFFISCELAHQAMGLESKRIFKIIFDIKTQNSILRQKIKNQEDEDLPKYSLSEKKFRELEFYNRYLLFYPESVIMNYLEEKELLKIALRILHKTNLDKFDAIEVMKFFDEKMLFYPKKYKDINRSVRYRYYDILLNLVKIYEINDK